MWAGGVPSGGDDQGQRLDSSDKCNKAVMKDLGNERFTEITIKAVSYDGGMTDDLFQERFLRRPPSQWIQ